MVRLKTGTFCTGNRSYNLGYQLSMASAGSRLIHYQVILSLQHTR